MTQVHRLSWIERAGLTIQNEGWLTPRKNLDRSDIPKIRRLARKGYTVAQVMAALNITDMCKGHFHKQCRKLQISFARGPHSGRSQ